MRENTEQLRKTMAKNVRFLLTENRLQAKELSKKIGLELRTLDRLLNAEYMISLNYLILIADYFNVSLDYIVGRTNNFKDLEYDFLSKVIESIRENK